MLTCCFLVQPILYENGFIHFVWAIILSVFLLFTEADNNESLDTL